VSFVLKHVGSMA